MQHLPSYTDYLVQEMTTNKYLLLLSVVTFSLLGLVFIQYRLLHAGLALEKQRLDQRVTGMLREVEYSMDASPLLRSRLISLYRKQGQPLAGPEYLLPYMVIDSIRGTINKAMRTKGIAVEYSFAVFTPQAPAPFVQAPDFEREVFSFEKYRTTFRGELLKECHCELLLEVHVRNSFRYLLQQMAYLILPSILFALALAGCLVFLMVQIQRLKALDSIKNDFINNLTHELKTPVFAGRLLLRLLRKALQGAQIQKANEYLDRLEVDNQQIAIQVEKVLELASMEGGRYHLDKQFMDINDLLPELAAQFLPLAIERGGILQLHCAGSTPLMVYGDRLHLRNAIGNLIDNALKYGGDSPSVTLSAQSDGNGQVIISVEDHGIGIAPQYQRAIFDKFYRVPTGDIHQVKGFGLGLKYVQQITTAHGGRVGVESKPGQGSIFYIYLKRIKQ